MSIEENKALIRRWVDARNRTDIPAALDCWVEEKRDWLRAAFGRFSTGFPDLRFTIDEIISEGDKVVMRWTLRGTHLGVWRGIPATGKPIEWTLTDIYTVSDGRLSALARGADHLGLLKQMGVVATWQDRIIE
jgi:predicted ester cyclase